MSREINNPIKLYDKIEYNSAFPKPLHTLEPGTDFQVMRLLPIDSQTVKVQFYSSKSTSEYTYTVDNPSSNMEELLFHQHDFFELMLVMNGEVEEYIEGGHNVFSAYDACIMNRNTRHFELINQAEIIYFCMSRDFVNNTYFPHSPLSRKKGDFNTFFRRNLDQNSRNLKDYMAFFHKDDQCQSAVSELILTIIEELKNRYPGCLSIYPSVYPIYPSCIEHVNPLCWIDFPSSPAAHCTFFSCCLIKYGLAENQKIFHSEIPSQQGVINDLLLPSSLVGVCYFTINKIGLSGVPFPPFSCIPTMRPCSFIGKYSSPSPLFLAVNSNFILIRIPPC